MQSTYCWCDYSKVVFLIVQGDRLLMPPSQIDDGKIMECFFWIVKEYILRFLFCKISLQESKSSVLYQQNRDNSAPCGLQDVTTLFLICKKGGGFF